MIPTFSTNKPPCEGVICSEGSTVMGKYARYPPHYARYPLGL